MADIRVYDGTDIPGAAIPASTVQTDQDGMLPQIWFPAGDVDRLWVSVNGGPPAAIDAENRYRINQGAFARPGIYLPPDWRSSVRRKLAQSATGKCVISVMGASTTQGLYASSLRNKGWLGQLRTALQAAYGDGGSGFKGAALTPQFQANQGVAVAVSNVYTAAGDLNILTGTWTVVDVTAGGYGPGAQTMYTQSVGGKFQANVRGSTVRVYTHGGGGFHSPFTVKIDAGAAQPVVDIGGGEQIQVTTISGLSAGTHQVVLTYTGDGTTNYLAVAGVTGENNAGVVVNDLSRPGSRAVDFGNFLNPDLGRPWNGGVQYPADLVILAHGPSDAQAGDTGPTWAKAQRQIMTRVRESRPDADIMIVLPHVGLNDIDTSVYQDYAIAARGLAESFDAALVDMWAVGRNSWNYWQSLGYWGNPTIPGAVGVDSVHPSDAGHQAIANLIFGVLGEA